MTKDLLTGLTLTINDKLAELGKDDRLEITFQGNKAGVQRITRQTADRKFNDKVFILMPDSKKLAFYYLTGFLHSLTI